MTLIECPDCGKQASDAAPACIGCGRPLAEFAEEREPAAEDAEPLGGGMANPGSPESQHRRVLREAQSKHEVPVGPLTLAASSALVVAVCQLVVAFIFLSDPVRRELLGNALEAFGDAENREAIGIDAQIVIAASILGIFFQFVFFLGYGLAGYKRNRRTI